MTEPRCTELIAHRGASRDAPENTAAAFALAWRQGADGIETDFRLTRDERVVCIHDASTGRTADRDICIADSTLKELRQLDMGAWKGDAWRGERILTLEELLERLPSGKRLFIELKCGDEIVEPLKKILGNYSGDVRQFCILAFDAPLLGLVKQQMPETRACLNVEYRWSPPRRWHPSREEVLDTLERIGADGLSSQDRVLLNPSFVAELRRRGKEVHVWTVDSVRSARHYFGLGVDSVMSNRPGWLRDKLR